MSTPNDNTNVVCVDRATLTDFELELLAAFHDAPEHVKAEICVLLHLEASQYTRQASSVEGELITSGTGKVLLNTGNKGRSTFEQNIQPVKLTFAADSDSDPELRPRTPEIEQGDVTGVLEEEKDQMDQETQRNVDEEEEVKEGKEEGQDAAAGCGIPSVRESRVARYRRDRPADFCPAYFLEPYSDDDEEDDTQGVH